MTNRFPGYDVLTKHDGPSWNDATRDAVDRRLAVPRQPRFFSEAEFRTLDAVCARIMPQLGRADPIPLAALVDAKMASDSNDGFRYPSMPRQGEAWRRGLAAIEEASMRDRRAPFTALGPVEQDDLLRSLQDGSFRAEALGGMEPVQFFKSRIISDIVSAYYSHPTSWNEIGWAGPASPRGYVRLDLGQRDPWEPEEAKPGHEAKTERINRHVR